MAQNRNGRDFRVQRSWFLLTRTTSDSREDCFASTLSIRYPIIPVAFHCNTTRMSLMSYFGTDFDFGPCDLGRWSLSKSLAQDSEGNLEGFANLKGLKERATVGHSPKYLPTAITSCVWKERLCNPRISSTGLLVIITTTYSRFSSIYSSGPLPFDSFFFSIIISYFIFLQSSGNVLRFSFLSLDLSVGGTFQTDQLKNTDCRVPVMAA